VSHTRSLREGCPTPHFDWVQKAGIAFGMNATPSSIFRRWRALPIFGPHWEDFVQMAGGSRLHSRIHPLLPTTASSSGALAKA
jgi:hypothetical protein